MFQDNKWFKFFMPPKSSFSNVREFEKAMLLLQSLPVFGVMVFISLIQKGIVTGELSFPHIAGIFALAWIPVILKSTRNYKLSASLLIGAGMILIPVNAINEGGFLSNGISWFGIIPIVSIFFLGPNTGLWIAFASIVELIFVGLLHNYDQVPMIHSELANSYSYRAISTLSLVIFSTVFARLYERQSMKSEEELKRASDIAEAAIQEKNTFWTTISHEIKTPLNGILGLSEVMMGSSLTKDQREYLSHIKDSAEALNLILRDVIDFSQLDKGEIQLMKSPSEIRSMLDQLVSLFSFSANSKGIQLSWIADQDIPDNLILDEKRLSQILSNLLSNAIKFTHRGHVKIIVEHEQKRNHYKFTVEDTGLGIDRDQLNTLFVPFKQKSETKNIQQWGTGLGLAICHRLCLLMGSGIVVRSSVGKGSRFSFVIEAQAIQLSVPDKAYEIQAPLLKRGNNSYILVAEDNLINQKLLTNHLEKLGHRFKLVSNGLEAVNLATTENFDLILMDIQMPIMNGITASQKIKETLRERAPKIIAVSANVIDIEQENLNQSGVIDYLAKPISLHSLRNCLKKHCDYYQDPRVLYKELERNEAVMSIVKNHDIQSFVDKDQLLEHFEYDIELIQSLKEQFQLRFSQSFKELDQAIDLDDFESIRMASHSLKGAVANFFCDPLKSCALAMEQKASVHDNKGLKDLLMTLKNDVPKLIDEVDAIIKEQEVLRKEAA